MQLRNRCGQPPREALAINDSSTPLRAYAPELRGARHWLGVELSKLGPRGDAVRVEALGILYNNIAMLNDYTQGPPRAESPLGTEWNRLHGIGMLSLVTMLIREPDIPLDTPNPIPRGESRYVTSIIDLGAAASPEAYEDLRLHVRTATPEVMPAGNTDQWYCNDGLWIHQVRPAQPTVALREHMASIGATGLPQHGTLIPYLQAK